MGHLSMQLRTADAVIKYLGRDKVAIIHFRACIAIDDSFLLLSIGVNSHLVIPCFSFDPSR